MNNFDERKKELQDRSDNLSQNKRLSIIVFVALVIVVLLLVAHLLTAK